MRRSIGSLIAVLVIVMGIGGCGGDSVGPEQKPEAHPQLSVVSGDGQTATVGTPLADDVVVAITLPDGTPVPDIAVTWTADSGSGTVQPAATTTNAQGRVQASWTLDTVAGQQHLHVSAADISTSSVAATATPGTPARFVKVSGDAQTGPFGVTLASALTAQILDQYGNGVPGIDVSFAATDGSITPPDATSGSDGTVNTTLHLPVAEGLDSVVATAGGGLPPLVFTATTRATTHLAHPASNTNSACALTPEGYAYCWGDNCCHQLGLGALDTSVAIVSPLPLPGGHRFTTIQVGDIGGCGLDTDQHVWCWGDQQYAQTGTGEPATNTPAMAPVEVAGGHTYAALSVGGMHACALTTSGSVDCWGSNLWGESGTGTVGTPVIAPTAVATPAAFSQVVASTQHTCALTADGSAYCWGSNEFGQLGVSAGTELCTRGSFAAQCATSPLPVAGGLHFASLITGWRHSCGLTLDGHAYCWGNNAEGELGDSTQTDRATPVPVIGGLTFVALSGRDRVTCGLTAAGKIYCWGYELSPYGGTDATCPARGQPGFYTSCQPTPTLLATTLTFRIVDMGNGQICGVATDDILYCWGFNYHGALGDGTTQDRTAPTRVLRQP